jgi:hypothetical protein
MPKDVLTKRHLDILYNLLMYIDMDVSLIIMQPDNWSVHRDLVTWNYVSITRKLDAYFADVTYQGLIAFRQYYGETRLLDALRRHEAHQAPL